LITFGFIFNFQQSTLNIVRFSKCFIT